MMKVKKYLFACQTQYPPSPSKENGLKQAQRSFHSKRLEYSVRQLAMFVQLHSSTLRPYFAGRATRCYFPCASFQQKYLTDCLSSLLLTPALTAFDKQVMGQLLTDGESHITGINNSTGKTLIIL